VAQVPIHGDVPRSSAEPASLAPAVKSHKSAQTAAPTVIVQPVGPGGVRRLPKHMVPSSLASIRWRPAGG